MFKMAEGWNLHKAMRENVSVVAPVKIIAVLLSLIAAVWFIVSIAGNQWVVVRVQYIEDRTWCWGLWNTCHIVQDGQSICLTDDWLTVCRVFSVMSLILCLIAIACGCLGVRLESQQNLMFQVAAALQSVVALFEFLVVIIFPVKFGHDLSKSEFVRRWDFDWTYGFAWGGLIFSIGSAVFFLMPVKSITISNKEDEEYSGKTSQ